MLPIDIYSTNALKEQLERLRQSIDPPPPCMSRAFAASWSMLVPMQCNKADADAGPSPGRSVRLPLQCILSAFC